MSTPTVRKVSKNWIDIYSNCTEASYEGRGSVSCIFEDTIHLGYISHVFLNVYERSPNEFEYTGTRTANATKVWLLENPPRDDKRLFAGTTGSTRFQNMRLLGG